VVCTTPCASSAPSSSFCELEGTEFSRLFRPILLVFLVNTGVKLSINFHPGKRPYVFSQQAFFGSQSPDRFVVVADNKNVSFPSLPGFSLRRCCSLKLISLLTYGVRDIPSVHRIFRKDFFFFFSPLHSYYLFLGSVFPSSPPPISLNLRTKLERKDSHLSGENALCPLLTTETARG